MHEEELFRAQVFNRLFSSDEARAPNGCTRSEVSQYAEIRNFALHHALSGIVIGESHVIEMWTGKGNCLLASQ